MFLKIFLAAITVCSLLGCLGANRRDNKRLAAVVAVYRSIRKYRKQKAKQDTNKMRGCQNLTPFTERVIL